MTFKIILCKNTSIGSKLLRLAMWSRWSHSAMLDEARGVVYDSTLWHGGVRCWPLAEFLAHYPATEFRDCEVAAERVPEAREWLAAQLGKGYDWTALTGFLFQRNWQEPDKWFCSELTETFRSAFSTSKLRAGAWRVTPHHQDIVL